jgi:hypothetical protein
MARGIVTNIGTGGTPPKLIITDFDPTQKTEYVPGKEMVLVSKIEIKEGYLLQGTVADDGHGTITFTVTSVLDNNPTIITNNTNGNIIIGTDQVYMVVSTGQITGNVSVEGGVLLVNGGKAAGNVSIAANSSIICLNGASVGGGTFEVGGSGTNAAVALRNTTINGKFSTSGLTYVDLGENNFNGNVSSSQDGYVTIKNNTINNNKNLTVAQVVNECNVSNNTVSGSTTLDPKCQP